MVAPAPRRCAVLLVILAWALACAHGPPSHPIPASPDLDCGGGPPGPTLPGWEDAGERLEPWGLGLGAAVLVAGAVQFAVAAASHGGATGLWIAGGALTLVGGAAVGGILHTRHRRSACREALGWQRACRSGDTAACGWLETGEFGTP